MKIVYMLGSLRKESLNAIIAEQLQTLAPAGAVVEALGSVGDIPHYDADIQAEGFPEEVIAMGDAIRQADAVVVVTPEYNYSIPGTLKNALDWLSRLPENPFTGKAVSIISASPGAIGGARAQYHLRQVFVFLNANVLNKPEAFVGLAGTKVDVKQRSITDEKTLTFLGDHLKALVDLAAKAS